MTNRVLLASVFALGCGGTADVAAATSQGTSEGGSTAAASTSSAEGATSAAASTTDDAASSTGHSSEASTTMAGSDTGTGADSTDGATTGEVDAPCLPIDDVLLVPNAVRAALAWNGSEYGLLSAVAVDVGSCDTTAWQFSRVSSDGQLVGSTTTIDIALPTGFNTQSQPAGLVWAEDRWLMTVLSASNGAERVTLVQLDGKGVVASVMPLAVAQMHGAVWDGSSLVVAWISGTIGSGGDLLIQRFDADGTAMGDPLTLATGLSVNSDDESISIDVAGDGYALALASTVNDTNPWHVQHFRLGGDLQPVAAPQPISNQSQYYAGGARVVGVGEGSLVLWPDQSAPARPMEVRLFAGDGTPLGVQQVSTGSDAWVLHGALARAQDDRAAAWLDWVEPVTEIHFVRLAEDGSPVGAELELTDGNVWYGCGYNDRVSLTARTGGYGVAWAAGPNIHFVQVCEGGGPIPQ